jgi:hypothetical protein
MKKTERIWTDILLAFDDQYQKDNQGRYINHNNIPFVVDCLKNTGAIVVEYQDNYEDGDLYFISDYDSIQSLVEDVREEIDTAT